MITKLIEINKPTNLFVQGKQNFREVNMQFILSLNCKNSAPEFLSN